MTPQPRLRTIEWNGLQISKPGMYSRISLETYHKGDICVGRSVSSSGLRTLSKLSPAHFYDEWPGNPDFVSRETTDAMTLGRAVHHLVLGELFFSKLFVIRPAEYIAEKTGEVKPWTYAAKVCKEWRENAIRTGRSILTPEDAEAIRGMAESLARHPIVQHGALNGLIERSLFFTDATTGLWLKSRPDSIPTASGDFVDLKTCRSVLWHDLQQSIFDYGYHQQGALIRRAAREVLGLDSATVTLIWVENKRPYCVEVTELKSNELDRGDKQNRAALDTVARCLESGEWPGPGGDHSDARPIEMPKRLQELIDERLEFGVS